MHLIVNENQVMVMDDEVSIRRGIARFLRKEFTDENPSKKVVAYETADELLGDLPSIQPPPTLMILDITTPGKNSGVDIAEWAKGNRVKGLPANLPNCYVAMLTSATPEDEQWQQCVDLGVDKIYTKPDTREELKALARQIIMIATGVELDPTSTLGGQ